MDRNRRKLLIGVSLAGALGVAGMLPATCARQQRRTKSAMPQKGSPKRPPGQPKPLIDEDIAPVLARLDAWYAAHLPPDQYQFNPPATEMQLDAFERLVGIKLPQAFHQLYRWHDGEESDRWGHIYGIPLLPLQEAGSQWTAWNGVLSEIGGDRYKVSGGGWPEGAVDPAYINPRWIPLTHDGSGNHIGLDFDPWPRGRVGQVILFGRDEDTKVVLAESLCKFFEWVVELLESGNFRLEAKHDERALRTFRLKTPATDDFQDGARALLGAPDAFG